MRTKSKRNRRAACWTCRLRHKRCDGSLPRCGACSALEISCHHGDRKPDWMDDGEQQRQMTQQFKTEVRQSARRRRGISLMQNIAHAITTRTDEPAPQLSRLASYASLNRDQLARGLSTSEQSTTLDPTLSLCSVPSGAAARHGQHSSPSLTGSEIGMGF